MNDRRLEARRLDASLRFQQASNGVKKPSNGLPTENSNQQAPYTLTVVRTTRKARIGRQRWKQRWHILKMAKLAISLRGHLLCKLATFSVARPESRRRKNLGWHFRETWGYARDPARGRAPGAVPGSGWASLSDTMIASIRRAAELSSLAEEVLCATATSILSEWFAWKAQRRERAARFSSTGGPSPSRCRSRSTLPPMAPSSPGRRASRQAGVGTAPSRETRRTARRPTGKGHPARRPRPPTTEAASDQDRAP